ncbi:tRNA (guanosine(37)-N1)-methyltransferase TrmD [Taylorella equigenitalis]|uniref:tRNA (guanine-N(1)-)-methyltransferase n=3 Tax=Taylorella equigenitalis TaxID=29575 RepID=A0A654KIK3_TAYEM|nr:tRNA (guanosine(37)-N1)-methyltransferase TrmD [Taylorella equigenitalis]ADU92154.1 tRNA (Guanine37-N1)-methyltransferase [Taylorella equigenitalis MCE9]AFN35715.1 tRNA (guanine-N(1)-)-methyltransferase [Taylorella equigenitalis ATCC 35865]ASY30361.1 tRNA (guanosine(37)-N1)-methyltransferase TrmD [Taylorella equigenitalis]ASY37667.1 tRNA (guanosine(37)-N1)-methyltransferase TrmD [Taylorella equigenitalis]ASY39135.1 tRNA (guanosine(37)-N1)-methyltransferase TrmD [Taylorella equigenitalis]
MRIDVITLFPELINSVSKLGVTGRALEKGIWTLKCWNPRDYTTDIHHTIDDRPYGGGPGMVMLAEPLRDVLLDVKKDREISGCSSNCKVVYLSPSGVLFKQSLANKFCETEGFILICGRYEGIDQRFIDKYVDQQISIGDYVLSGGELPALAIIDTVTRLLPGVINTPESHIKDSFQDSLKGLLDHPHYTRPEVFEGMSVPKILLSGNHKEIERWREEQSIEITRKVRPDLINE